MESSIEERRQFLLKAGSLLGISVCASSLAVLLNSCEVDESKIIATHGTVVVDIATESDLQSVGGSAKKVFRNYNQGHPVIILRTKADSFLVVSAVCNHAGCIVSIPVSKGANIVCNPLDNKCGHNAEFDPITGTQVVGASGASPSGGLTVIPSTYDATNNKLSIVF